MTIRLMIIQDKVAVADVPSYDGPIPCVGDWIIHPRHTENTIGKVKSIGYHILDGHISSTEKDNPVYDTGAGNPVVEIEI